MAHGHDDPASGVVTANEIHIPVGKPLLVQLETADGIHSLWAPRLGRVEIDVKRFLMGAGLTNHLGIGFTGS